MNATRPRDQGPQAATGRPGGESPPSVARRCSGNCRCSCPKGALQDQAPLRFEQRQSPRETARGRLTASFRDPAGQQVLTRVELADASDTGLGVYAPLPAQVGSTIALHDGPRAIYAGTVARCQTSLTGHLIGLRLVGPAQAA